VNRKKTKSRAETADLWAAHRVACRAETAIAERRLISRGAGVVVAVSGGLDSMVLLEVLARLAPRHNWRLAVAHLNHGLRGRSSDADERLVKRTAARLRLRFVSERADVAGRAKERGISVEMAGRELRHKFLSETAASLGFRTIALAHHADDQVELFLLRLLRGAGSEGLAGMKWRSASPHRMGMEDLQKGTKRTKGSAGGGKAIELIRPLLGITKKEMAEYARKMRVRFREDATNAQLDFQRNRIRHELLPMLEAKYQPAVRRVILRQMEILGEEGEFMLEEASKWLKRLRSAECGVRSGRKASRRQGSAFSEAKGGVDTKFAGLPVAVQRRVLQIQAEEAGVGVNYELIEQLRREPGRLVSVGEGLAVSRSVDGTVSVRQVGHNDFNGREMAVELRGMGGVLTFDGVEIAWRALGGWNGTIRARKAAVNLEHFDADKVGERVVLRHWRPGDRFQPIGMREAVKLQDLFTNEKVLRERRRELMVATTASGEIFWVEGVRLAERFKLDKGTRRRLKWEWKRLYWPQLLNQARHVSLAQTITSR